MPPYLQSAVLKFSGASIQKCAYVYVFMYMDIYTFIHKYIHTYIYIYVFIYRYEHYRALRPQLGPSANNKRGKPELTVEGVLSL